MDEIQTGLIPNFVGGLQNLDLAESTKFGNHGWS
jgi:hypothetical protein